MPLFVDRTRLDEHECVSGDVLCVRCGYNLRTLSIRSVCPECAHPVRASVMRDELQYAPKRWVRTLARGAWLLAAVPLMLFVVLVVGALCATLAESTAGGWSRTWNTLRLLVVTPTLWLAPPVALVGVFLITARDPRARNVREILSLRRVLRLAATLAGLGVVLTRILPANSAWRQNAAGITTIVALGVLPMLLLRYVQLLLRRTPEKDLARQAHRLLWIQVTTVFLFLALGLLHQLSDLGLAALAVYVASPIIALAVVVAAGALLFMTARTLSRLARHAPGEPIGPAGF